MDSITRIKDFIHSNFPEWTKVDFSIFEESIDFRTDLSELYKITDDEIILISYTNISITGKERPKPQLRVFLDEYKKPFYFAKRHQLRYYLFSIFTKDDEMARGLDNFNPKEYIISIETNLDIEGSRRDLRSIYDYANEKLHGRKFLKCSRNNYKADINQASLIYIGSPKSPDKDTFNDFINIFDSRPYLNSTNDRSRTLNNANCHQYNELINLLIKRRNVILTGAPGTGKTFTAKAMAANIISDGKSDWNGLTEEQKKQVAFVQFHPSYDYTDFVEGLRPVSGGEFRRQDGVFKAFCKRAAIDSPNPYIFIIDEINRGELSKIFGELFYAIEPDYRGKTGIVQTQYNNLVEEDDVFKAGFYIPENVYIIGTMNDVDRGVEAMDFAIRRRFAWIEVTAEESAENMGITGLALKKMEALNTALMTNGLSRAYCIGGAYFRKLENDDYDSLWKYHLEGIVYEYFRGEPDAEEKLQAVKKAYEEAKLPTTSEPIEEKEAVPAE